jgi:hypothetical protein
MLKAYLKSLCEVSSTGDAREESYYSTLEGLLGSYAKSIGKNDIHIRTLPKKTEAGNPDFRVWDGNLHIVGYVEAKVPTTEDLDQIEESEQLQRYRHTFPNLLLTNFFEFRFYRDGDLVDKVVIGRPFVMHKLGKTPPIQNEPQFLELLEKFFSYSLPKVTDAKTLAVELAKRTRFLRDVVAEQLREENIDQQGVLLGFYEAFQKYLIAKLTLEDFADLYAQTVTYGLFAARTRAQDSFSRRQAYDHIPRTIGILRDVFQFISLGDLPKQVEWIVDDISEVLAVADAGGILDRYYREGKGSDPIVHFYETFLAEYDPEERERRGVYYTPEPVVSYIVRSLHLLLKEQFHRAEGLASEGVTLLDPAAGTMTFVARACQEAVREFEHKFGAGGREEFIRKHILQNYYAFELMMAPYAVGHLKMAFFLEELGHRLTDEERFKFYLTNTLEMEELEQTHLPGMASLAEESHLAAQVKEERPILVILGNPPYSGHSSNRGDWILGLIGDYRQVDGKPLGEKNPKWLQDDYVKFLRFAQWKIDQEDQGVVGMITNHSYLDNPTFRGMRQSLMRTFDEIYLLDLHGNSLKRETAPDGGKDENVFDIRQGVAIALFVKSGEKKQDIAKVYHADLWGLREAKYDYLQRHDMAGTTWQDIHPKQELYLFVPRDESAAEEYESFHVVNEVFPVNGVGMTTARDEFVIDMDKSRLLNRVRLFKHSKGADDELHRFFDIRKKTGWSIRKAWNMLQDIGDEELAELVMPILYRPFDVRWIFYHDSVVWRTVKRIMRHMLTKENLALCVGRSGQVVGGAVWNLALCSAYVTDFNLFYRGGNLNHPLYLYADTAEKQQLSHLELGEKEPNLNPALIASLTAGYRQESRPEDILHYVYAVLYSETYRRKYAEFLKRDFPRIPFTKSYRIFQRIAALGKRLVGLHLLRSAELDPPMARFEGQGDNRVAQAKSQGLRYESREERVHINKTQYFEPVPLELWEYQIGGYQVLEKWLKDRRNRQLTLDEIKTYCRIVTAIRRTIEIQEEIDALYPEAEAQTIPVEAEP